MLDVATLAEYRGVPATAAGVRRGTADDDDGSCVRPEGRRFFAILSAR
jgi:hypothetical protein